MTIDDKSRDLFETQLKTCRRDVSWGHRGKYPLGVFLHGGEAYPLFDDKDWGAEYEFVWFCQHTGQGAFMGRFEAIDDFASSSDDARYISRQARTFCANPNCDATSVAGLSSSKCPRCGNDSAVMLFSLKKVDKTIVGSVDLPQEFRGQGLTMGKLHLLWNLLGAFMLGVFLASFGGGEDSDKFAVALLFYTPIIVAISYAVLKHRAKIRGGITITREGFSFRQRNSAPAQRFPFTGIAVLHAEYDVIRGALFFVMRRDFNIFLYAADGSRLFSYRNERFSPDQAVEFLEMAESVNPELMIFASLLIDKTRSATRDAKRNRQVEGTAV